MPSSPPSLSVLVLCRNYERYFAECLRSVMAADQECQIVVVDNGSRDKSVDVARATLSEAPSHITHKLIALDPEQTLPRALNIAHRECTGEFVKLLSADDLVGPNFFASFREAVAISDARVGVWLAGSLFIDETRRVHRQTHAGREFGSPLDGPPAYLDERGILDHRLAPAFCAPSEFHRRQVFVDVGGFDERFRYEDKPFYFNAIKCGWKIIVHPYNNSYYRVHSAGVSSNAAWMAEARLPVMWNHTLRADWRNKPLALTRLASNVRVVASNRWKSWRAQR